MPNHEKSVKRASIILRERTWSKRLPLANIFVCVCSEMKTQNHVSGLLGNFTIRAQFHRTTNLLSTEYLRLAKIGYQPNCHVMYIASGRFSANFCLADKFAKQ